MIMFSSTWPLIFFGHPRHHLPSDGQVSCRGSGALDHLEVARLAEVMGKQLHGRRTCEIPSGNLTIFNIAIENGPVEIVDFPINSMVIFHSYVKLAEGMYTIASGKLTVGTLWFSPQFRSGFTNLPSPDAWQGLSLLIYCCVTWRVLYEY